MPGEKYSSYKVGGGAWRQRVMETARQTSDQISNFIDNDFSTNTSASSATTLSGTVTYDTGLTGGVARIKTGVTPFATAIVYNAGGSALVNSPLDESWYVHARAWIKNVPTGDTTVVCVGIQDTVGLNPQFITFGWVADYDATHLILTMNSQDGSIDVRYSTVEADIVGFHDYGFGRDMVDDKLYAMLDGYRILDLDGPFNRLTSQACFVCSGFTANTSGQDYELWVDNIAAVVQES